MMKYALWATDIAQGESFCAQMKQLAPTMHCVQLELLSDHKSVPPVCEVLFIQVERAGEWGLQHLEEITEQWPLIVFIVPSGSKCIGKLKTCAMEYLGWPATMKEMRELEKRLADMLAMKNESSDFNKGYIQALNHLVKQGRKRKWDEVVIPDVKGYTLLPPERLVRLECEGPYTNLYLDCGRRVLANKPIRHFDEILENHAFVRIQPTNTINLNHMKSWQSDHGVTVTLNDGTALPVVGRSVPLFLEAFRKWSQSPTGMKRNQG
jgi:two-component system, LytTR family, response regulator